MASFYSEMEKAIKSNSDAGLDVLLYYYGIELSLHRERDGIRGDPYGQVHGPNSGGPTEKLKDFIGVIQGDDYFPSVDESSSGFTMGFLYTKERDVKVGDTIMVIAMDEKFRGYKITEKENIGLTTEMITKWKITNVVEE